jgi:hypothetical protein
MRKNGASPTNGTADKVGLSVELELMEGQSAGVYVCAQVSHESIAELFSNLPTGHPCVVKAICLVTFPS